VLDMTNSIQVRIELPYLNISTTVFGMWMFASKVVSGFNYGSYKEVFFLRVLCVALWELMRYLLKTFRGFHERIL